MIMRFHFGLAVGHVYAHPFTTTRPRDDSQGNEDLDFDGGQNSSNLEDSEEIGDDGSDIGDDDLESEDMDLGLGGIQEEDADDDLEFEEFDAMYGPDNHSA